MTSVFKFIWAARKHGVAYIVMDDDRNWVAIGKPGSLLVESK